MIPVQFDYAAPGSLQEAVHYLTKHAGSCVLAGGTDLVPCLSRRLLAPTALVDLQRIPGLAGVDHLDGGGIRIGALVTMAALGASSEVDASYPILAEAIAALADPQIRNRATLGGSILQHRSGGDLLAALIALGGTVNVTGPGGNRSVAIDSLVTAGELPSLGQAEIITSIDLVDGAAGSAYEKARNPASGFAVCGVGAVVRVDNDSVVIHARIVVTGATRAPTRLLRLEAELVGQPSASAALSDTALEALSEALVFDDDWQASSEYRAQPTRVLAVRAVRRALTRTVHHTSE